MAKQILEQQDDDLAKMRRSCLMDDAYMKLFFDDDIECTQLVLRIIMEKKDLIVKSVKTQKYFDGVEGKRSIRLDIYAVDGEGLEYDIEIQGDNAGASPKRARFYSALIDAHMLEPNDPFDRMHECFVIFITENDVLGDGLPLYKIERYINGARPFNDGAKMLYVNASHQDAETELGRLMHDFMCINADEMYYEELASRAKYFKGGEKGESLMKGVWAEMQEQSRAEGIAEGLEKGRAEGRAEGKAEGIAEGRAEGKAEGRAEGKAEGIADAQKNFVLNMLKAGKLALNEIAEYSGMTLARVQELAKAL